MLILILALLVLLSAFFVAHLGKGWLYASIVANLFFVSLFGAKLIAVGGIVSNIGNVFYAGVFFATYLLIEHYGVGAAKAALWVGLYTTALFLLFTQLVGALTGVPLNQAADLWLGALFGVVPRIAVASIFAYIIAQHVNIWLYERLRQRGVSLWARATAAIVMAQGVDSVLFFYVAFAGVLSQGLLYESLWAGFVLKVGIGVLSIPLLYASYYSKGFDLRRYILPNGRPRHVEGPSHLGSGPLD